MRPLIPLVLTRAVVAAASAPASCRLLLVRHGETNYNAAGRIQGRLESELTQTGLEQAEKLGAWVDASSEALAVDRVFVSPKRRTRQTLAGIESAQRAPLPAAEVRPGLREIELTVWEGSLRSDLAESDPRWEQWKARPDGFSFEEDGHAPLTDLKRRGWLGLCASAGASGVSGGDSCRRAAEEWAALVAATPGGSTSLVVAHGAFNRVLVQTALGLPVDDFGFKDGHYAFENCALVELRWEAGQAHASAWRKRYPAPSEWRSREAEEVRRARAVEAGEPPDVEEAEHGGAGRRRKEEL